MYYYFEYEIFTFEFSHVYYGQAVPKKSSLFLILIGLHSDVTESPRIASMRGYNVTVSGSICDFG
jgi:hypothetical protein